MNSIASNRLLTERELSKRWSCSMGWLANERSAGRGPRYTKIGRMVRYREDDVATFEVARFVDTEGVM